jgi:hypothetical protein
MHQGGRGLLPAPLIRIPAAVQSPSERRKYHRIPTDQVISFAELDRTDQLAVSKNVSTGGISFEAVGCEIDLGDVLRVTFNIGDQTVVASGKVVWSTETDPITTEVGIEFHEIDPTALRLLEESVLESETDF